LINLGCLVRVVFQIGTDWHPMFFTLVGVSGMLEWTGLAIWACHLAMLMLGLGLAVAPFSTNGDDVEPK
jgi:hypothetical protein